VLEIGSGTGETAAWLAANSVAEIVAVDVSPAFTAVARERHRAPNLRFECFDLLGEVPSDLGRFDFVCGNGILHHLVRQLDAFLGTLHGLTNPGGGLAFIEPNLLNPYCAFIFGTRIGRRLARLEPEEMAFTPAATKARRRPAGWQSVQVTTRDFLLPGIPEALVRPTLAIEPALEATALTRWLAQSNFALARA
jgi:2-polyprenyl-3-methyl-5-hydroxy-6-metoxy-1,4-benzoquinol methylase